MDSDPDAANIMVQLLFLVFLTTVNAFFAGAEMAVVSVVLSFITLVFGELVPKRVALQKSEAFSLWTVGPIYAISRVMSPFIRLLSVSTNLVLKAVGMKNQDVEEKVSEEEIRALLESGKEQGVFNEAEEEMISSVFSFGDKIAKDVMVPRKEVFAIDIEEPLEDYMDELLEKRYSRIPVYRGDRL